MEEKVICVNRAASHEYFILDRIEAGIVLEGAEVKSLRMGNANIKDSFCFVRNGEVTLKNAHIAVYDKSGAYNTRNSKHEHEIYQSKHQIRNNIFIRTVCYVLERLCKIHNGNKAYYRGFL